MIENLYYVFIAGLFLFTIIFIIIDQIKKHKRKDKVIIKLKRGLGYHSIVGLIWLIFFIIFSYLFIYRAQNVYYVLAKDYHSIYQLFDLEYLKTTQKYFYDNLMLSELISIAFYRGNFLHMVTWISGSFCICLLNFYKAWQPAEILGSGIVVYGELISYDKFSGYKRGNLHNKKWMNKKIKYYDYFIMQKKKNILSDFGIKNEIKVYVDCGYEDIVDSNLDSFIK